MSNDEEACRSIVDLIEAKANHESVQRIARPPGREVSVISSRTTDVASSCGTANHKRTVLLPFGTCTVKAFLTWNDDCFGCAC
jgi:hypothetical protein